MFMFRVLVGCIKCTGTRGVVGCEKVEGLLKLGHQFVKNTKTETTKKNKQFYLNLALFGWRKKKGNKETKQMKSYKYQKALERS